MKHRDIAALMAGVAPVVKDYVATVAKRLDDVAERVDKSLLSLITRLEEVEARKAEKGDQGEPGERGEKGDQGEPGIAGAVGEKGDRGEPGAAGLVGERGEKGDPGEPGVAGPIGEKGDPGEKGIDGSPGKDANEERIIQTISDALERRLPELIQQITAGVVESRVAELPRLAGAVIDRDGHLVCTYSDGSTQNLGKVVGHDGAPGAPGRDGFSLSDFDTEMQPDGKTVLFKFGSGDILETHELFFGVPIDRGIWRDKEGGYQQGDCVTWGGSLFIAQKNTTTKPETAGSDWRLAVKRGRDGKDGKPGEKGERGPTGLPGKDGQWR